VWTNPPVRQIRLERIWTAEGWPRSAQREGVGPMDGPNNPRQRSDCRTADRRKRRFAYLAEREVWTNPPVTRRILRLALRASGFAAVRSSILLPRATILSGTKLDSRRLAPQRAARKGWAHGWAQQSPPTIRLPHRRSKEGRFAHLAQRHGSRPAAWWSVPCA